MLIKNARYYDGDFNISFADIRIEGDTITEIGKNLTGDKNIFDATGCTVIPGLIDVHIHGCHGADTSDASVSSLTHMSRFLASRGITSFIPTAISDTAENQQNMARALDKASSMPLTGARILGFRAEGSFLSPEKPGTHNVLYLRKPDIDEVLKLNEAAGGKLRIIDVAPELDNDFAFTEEAVKRGFIISLGHSNADYDTAMEAYRHGMTDTTHLFNAMSPFLHRSPGVVGAAFDTPLSPFCEIIADGHHVHPAVVRTAVKIIGKDRLVLISDGSPAVGMPDGNYKIGNVDIKVIEGVARCESGALAGSTVTVADCLFRITKMGIPFADALRAATINPARLIGADQKIGSIEVGKKGDIIALDSDNGVKRVIIGGKPFNRALAPA